MSYSPRRILGCAYTTCSHVQITISCTISCRSPSPFCANLLLSFIMWLIGLSLSPYNLHSLFSCVLSIFTLTLFILMALFCASIRRASVSLLRFPFFTPLIWDFVSFSLEISIQLFFFPCLFFSYCCSRDHCVVCLFLVIVISFSLLLLCSLRIIVSMHRC